MSILLPSTPDIRSAKPRLLDFGSFLAPPMGGPAQRLNRIGNRFAIDVELPSSRGADIGRIYVARLMRALTEGAVFAFPQDLDPGAVGTNIKTRVASETGSNLSLKGFPAGYQAKEGQFFSIIHGGRRYLHAMAADFGADGSGNMYAPIVPMLRVSPALNSVVEFAQPMIEGFLSGNAQEWGVQTAPYVDISFTITEAA